MPLRITDEERHKLALAEYESLEHVDVPPPRSRAAETLKGHVVWMLSRTADEADALGDPTFADRLRDWAREMA